MTEFLEPFDTHIPSVARLLMAWITKQYPQCNQLIYDNYSALAICWSLTDTAGGAFCALALYRGDINFGFNRGSEIEDPENLLKGSGSLYRYLKVEKKFPKQYVKKLMRQAYINALSRIKLKIGKGKKIKTAGGETIIKMSLSRKRR